MQRKERRTNETANRFATLTMMLAIVMKMMMVDVSDTQYENIYVYFKGT